MRTEQLVSDMAGLILLAAAPLHRHRGRLYRTHGGQPALARRLATIGPSSIAALLVTLVRLFAREGTQILCYPLIIAMLAVPIR